MAEPMTTNIDRAAEVLRNTSVVTPHRGMDPNASNDVRPGSRRRRLRRKEPGMTSEKKLRDMARDIVDAARLLDDTVLPQDHPELDDQDYERLCELVANYPIPDLPVPDEKGRFVPDHARGYDHVRRGVIRHPERGPETYVRIVRGDHPITLTLAEAEELSGILAAAAMEKS